MIQFQYFEGCPNAKESLAHLVQMQQELGIDEQEIEIVEVPDAETSERLHFQGSPTILINGIDIYTGESPTDSIYSCRVYTFDGKKTGIIPASFIRQKLATYAKME